MTATLQVEKPYKLYMRNRSNKKFVSEFEDLQDLQHPPTNPVLQYLPELGNESPLGLGHSHKNGNENSITPEYTIENLQ